MSEQYPVTVAVRREDGGIEQVRVGVAIRTEDGFSLQLGELSIGATPVRAAAPAYGGGGGAPMRSSGPPTHFPPYGRSKGAPISGATLQDLEYYANGCRRTLADAGKARFHDKERELLAVIEAELARQGHGTAESGGYSGGSTYVGSPGGGYGASGGGYGGGYGASTGGRGTPPMDPEPPPVTDDDLPF